MKAVSTWAAMLGLVLSTGIAGAADAPAASSAGQKWAKKASYGSWDVMCSKPASGKEICQAMQIMEVRNEKESRRVLRMTAQKGPDGIVFSFELPFGVDLRPGMIYQIDDKPEATVPYLTCIPSGCVATTALNDERSSQVSKGKQMKVGFRPLGSEKIAIIEVKLDGLDKALAAL